MEPRFNDLRYNDIPGLTINIRLPSKSYSKMYGALPQNPGFNDLRHSMGMSLTKSKIVPVLTIKSISQTTGNAIIVQQSKLFFEEYSGYCTTIHLMINYKFIR